MFSPPPIWPQKGLGARPWFFPLNLSIDRRGLAILRFKGKNQGKPQLGARGPRAAV
uniref:Uncharacterized protein n=1 Tax=Haematococcus lacustris TaxID=44745 RepID=A0A2K9YRU0_HAELA|nr:hypothetical protein SG3EUKT975002.1 [Haematococcus lacustris]AUW36455.1 hypothetical protein SG3EUKT975002.1 [Haematococcus lacustris]